MGWKWPWTKRTKRTESETPGWDAITAAMRTVYGAGSSQSRFPETVTRPRRVIGEKCTRFDEFGRLALTRLPRTRRTTDARLDSFWVGEHLP